VQRVFGSDAPPPENEIVFAGAPNGSNNEPLLCESPTALSTGGVRRVSDERLLVPVEESATLRQTVEYAVRVALSDDHSGYVRFVYVHSPEAGGDQDDVRREDQETATDAAAELLNRVTVWAREDAGDQSDQLTVETAQLGQDVYLFSPEDVAAILADDAREHRIDRIILDPEYDPGIGAPFLRPLEVELSRVIECQIEEAPTTVPTRRAPLDIGGTALQVGALFGLSFLFYQILVGTLTPLDLVTGTISATIVAVSLSRVTFSRDPSLRSLANLLRLVVYVPYLFWEILKANVQVAAVILHPRLPIDPRMTRITPAVWGGLPVTTLANSITLTPGTLTVRIRGRSLKVHTLLPASREDLFDGSLERAVRFVYYGRTAMNIPSLRERDAFEILHPSDENPPHEDDSEGESADQARGDER
jgi:multicomponent Na+:H+ antiporter subunit E